MSKVFISFDVDGTVVNFTTSVNVHKQAFSNAVEEVIAPVGDIEEFLGYSLAGWMDKKIIHHIVGKLGREPTEEIINEIGKRTEQNFIKMFTVIPEVPKGIKQILSELSKMPNVTIGLASGNLQEIAWKKLTNAGLIEYFPDRIGGFGGFVWERVEALKLARENAEKLRGYKFDKWFHVGDMPNDVDAALAAGATAVAVKTGHPGDHPYPSPSYIFNNLEECHDEFMKLIQ